VLHVLLVSIQRKEVQVALNVDQEAIRVLALPTAPIVQQEPIQMLLQLGMPLFVKSVLLVSIQRKEVQVAMNVDQEPIRVLALPTAPIVQQEPIQMLLPLRIYLIVFHAFLDIIVLKEVQLIMNVDQEPIRVLALPAALTVLLEPILILVDLLLVLDVLRVRYQRQDQVVAVANVLQEPSLFLALKNVMDVLRDIIRVLE